MTKKDLLHSRIRKQARDEAKVRHDILMGNLWNINQSLRDQIALQRNLLKHLGGPSW